LSRSPSVLQDGISWILRAGVALSLALESAGILWNYLNTGNSYPPPWFVQNANFFGFLSSILSSLAGGATPLAVTGLGVAVLVLTPYARIIAAVLYYAVEGDWKFVAITLSVFSIITVGLLAL
jgi:uncharacterized membrane protein